MEGQTENSVEKPARVPELLLGHKKRERGQKKNKERKSTLAGPNNNKSL